MGDLVAAVGAAAHYKAMSKTGTASREELAALLPKRIPQTDK
jgi:hypothetical protein